MKQSVSIFITCMSVLLLIGRSALTGEEVARLSIKQFSTNENNLIFKETLLDHKKDDEIAI